MFRCNAKLPSLHAFFVVFSCLCAYIQPTALAIPLQGREISISVKKSSLPKILYEISEKSGITIYFVNDELSMYKDITYEAKNKEVKNILADLLKDKGLQFEIISEKQIGIRRAKIQSEKFLSNAGDTLFSVTGRIISEKGRPLAGATVKVKNSNQGTTTDASGSFAIHDVAQNTSLLISSVAYLSEEVSIKGRRNLGTILLKEYIGMLDEMQVIAYGNTSRRLQTGNVVTIKAEDIERSPVSNPLLAVQGRVPGIFIEQASGLPGSGVKVRIQGLNSLNKGNDPLYVIDGVPYSAQLLPSINSILGTSGDGGFNVTGNPLSFINPSEIESIDVLKDADATSIYGSRASAGAILITTKKGKVGKTRININVENGWAKVNRKMKLLDTQQYLEMRNEAIANDGIDLSSPPYNEDFYKVYLFPDVSIWDQKSYTDWQKELIGGTADYKNVQATVSGGSVNTSFLIGANYKKEGTVFPGDLKDQKGSVHFNVSNTSLNKKFKVSLTGSYMLDNNRLQISDLTSIALTLPPNAPKLHNSFGNLNWEPYQQADGSVVSTFSNPLVDMNNLYKIKTENVISTAQLSYEILPGLDIKGSLGYTSLRTDDIITKPNSSYQPEFRQEDWAKGASTFGYGSTNSWNFEPQLSYQRSLFNGKVELLLGSTFYNLNNSRQVFNAQGFISDLQLEDIKAATQVQVDYNIGSINSKYRYSAVFGRVNYNWSGKYIANITFRRDGSSRFGTNNRFHNFASVSGVWIFTEEEFFNRMKFLSFGKLRISYGTTGNDQIGDYSYLSLYNTVNGDRPYQGSIGLRPGNLQNQYIQWEETRKLQSGIDLGFFDNRVLININYFLNRSSNQLLNYSLPTLTGQTGILVNFPATIQNSGWEFLVTTTNIQTNRITWTTSLNFTIPRNKLVDFPNLSTSTLKDRLVIGKPFNVQQLYRFGGVDATTGLYQFVDKDGKLTANPGNGNENRTELFNPNPKFYGGLQNSLTYKGVQLDFLLQYVKQMGENYLLGNFPGIVNTNQPKSVLDRWKKIGDNSIIQQYSTYNVNSNSDNFLLAKQSTQSYSDASYIRLKNVSLYVQLPKSLRNKLRLENARIYILAQNLLTITKYEGLDPENRNVGSLPPLRIISAGINLTL